MSQDPSRLDLRFLALTGGVVLITAFCGYAIVLSSEAVARDLLGEKVGPNLHDPAFSRWFLAQFLLAALALWLVSLAPCALVWWALGRRLVPLDRPPYEAALLVTLLGLGLAVGGAFALDPPLGKNPLRWLLLTGYGLVPLGAALLLTRRLYGPGAKGVGE
jgi:hypothetical protein